MNCDSIKNRILIFAQTSFKDGLTSTFLLSPATLFNFDKRSLEYCSKTITKMVVFFELPTSFSFKLP
uniref:Uncharacterized protein n=1 Tax=Romanomermis culicivorax TaxID=13658 RepID=A0A915K2W7_ROMCU